MLPTADLVEYWSKDKYCLIAMTTIMRAAARGRQANPNFEYRYTDLEAGGNPYGMFPFWVLQNIRSDPDSDPTFEGCLSDLDDVEELNKHYNLMVSEDASEIATNIHRPIVYASEEHIQEPSSIAFTPGAVIPIGIEEKLETLDWSGEPAAVQNHMDRVLQGIQDITFLGEAGFGRLTAGMSGIGFKIALSPLEQIVELKVPQRVRALKGACKFILKCFEENAGSSVFRAWITNKTSQFAIGVQVSASDINHQYDVDIDYGNLLPRDDYAHAQNEVYLFKTGVQSLYSTLEHLGFDDPNSEIDKLKREAQDPLLNPEKYMMIQQATMAGKQEMLQREASKGLPGTASPTTRPVQPGTLGGMSGVPGGPGQGPPGAMPGNTGMAPPGGNMQQILQMMSGSGPGMFGLPGGGPGTAPTAPTTPGPEAEELGQGPGRAAPFMKRGR